MRRRTVVSVVMAAMIVAGCSDSPQLVHPVDRNPDVLPAAEPEVFASGTVSWGPGPSQQFHYEIEEILGFATAVTMRATAESKISVRSIAPRDDEDPFWLAGIVLFENAPPIVFGGADRDIDRMLLVNADGEELTLELVKLDDRDWLFTIAELPTSWNDSEVAMEAVALRDGSEVARKTVGLG